MGTIDNYYVVDSRENLRFHRDVVVVEIILAAMKSHYPCRIKSKSLEKYATHSVILKKK